MGDSARPAGAARWGDLGRRVVSASLLAPIVLFCIWFGAAPYVVLILATAVGLSLEWVGLCGARPLSVSGMLMLATVLIAAAAAAIGDTGTGLVLLAGGVLITWWASQRVLLASGIVYVGLAIIALLWLRGWLGADGRAAVMFVVFVVWASDIGAYAAGRIFAGPKLAPSLSPAKKWSGALGGLVFAMIVGEVMAGHVTLSTAVYAGVLAVACQAGDLLESGIKRHVGVKDSGRLIPGHGGLLDRLDGLLAAAPVAALVVFVSREGIFWH